MSTFSTKIINSSYKNRHVLSEFPYENRQNFLAKIVTLLSGFFLKYVLPILRLCICAFKHPFQQYWHCYIVTIYPFKLSQYYTLVDSHNVALKCHKVAKLYMLPCGKIIYATMWQKIVTTYSHNLLYVTSVTKMWHFCSLLWLVDFLSQREKKTAVLQFTFYDTLISIFAVWGVGTCYITGK